MGLKCVDRTLCQAPHDEIATIVWWWANASFSFYPIVAPKAMLLFHHYKWRAMVLDKEQGRRELIPHEDQKRRRKDEDGDGIDCQTKKVGPSYYY